VLADNDRLPVESRVLNMGTKLCRLPC
jgi:hypothetical protein